MLLAVILFGQVLGWKEVLLKLHNYVDQNKCMEFYIQNTQIVYVWSDKVEAFTDMMGDV